MSLYGDYNSEREDKNIIEDDKGFMTFVLIPPDTLYLEDIYVKPEFRKQGHAKVLFEKVKATAKSWGCPHITTSIKPSANGSTDSLKVSLTAGFQLLRASQDAIILIKGVDDGESN